jgi:HSP20 family protein
MAWNEVVSQVRDKIRRRLGRRDGERVFVTTNPVEPLSGAPLATPAVDVYENEREFLVVADVPGATRDGATIACDGPRRLTLFVKGEPAPDGIPWASEYGSRDWFRVLDFPAYTDGPSATSTLRDGVLTIRIPKHEVKPRLVPVHTA